MTIICELNFSGKAVAGITVGEAELDKPHIKNDPIDGLEKEVYIDKSNHRLPLHIGADVPPGEYQVDVTAGYQGCSKVVCYFPQKKS